MPISVGQAESLPYSDNSFDVVLSFDVFEHIPDSNKHLREVRRILKGKGHYLLGMPNKWINVPFEIIAERSFTKYKGSHCALHSYLEVKKRFKKNGFKVKFIDIPVVNDFFREKIKNTFGSVGLFLIKIINPDKLPIFFRTNFYIVAKKID